MVACGRPIALVASARVCVHCAWSVVRGWFGCRVRGPERCPESARRVVAAYDSRRREGRPVVKVEDAFVGILSSESGVHASDITEYVQDPPAGREQTPALFGGRMLVHRVTDPEHAFEWITFPVHVKYFDRADLHGLRQVRTSSRAESRAESRAQASQVRRCCVSCCKWHVGGRVLHRRSGFCRNPKLSVAK